MMRFVQSYARAHAHACPHTPTRTRTSTHTRSLFKQTQHCRVGSPLQTPPSEERLRRARRKGKPPQIPKLTNPNPTIYDIPRCQISGPRNFETPTAVTLFELLTNTNATLGRDYARVIQVFSWAAKPQNTSSQPMTRAFAGVRQRQASREASRARQHG